MPEFGDVLDHSSSVDNHPAAYDQNIERLKDLIPEVGSFLFCGLVPTDEPGRYEMNILLGKVPGMSTATFAANCMRELSKVIREAIEEEERWAEREGEYNGSEEED